MTDTCQDVPAPIVIASMMSMLAEPRETRSSSLA